MLLTNRFEPEYFYENIDRDYDIYAVTKMSEKLDRTNILDIPTADYKAKAVQYLWGRVALVLFDKGQVSDSSFRMAFQETYRDVSVQKLDILNEDIRRKYFFGKEYLLANLLINTLKSPQTAGFRYNNLTGKLYYRDSSWKWKDFIWFLNIRFERGMLLKLSVTTFKKVARRENRRCYLFDADTGAFRKELKEDDAHGELYAAGSIPKHRNTVDFIRFDDYKRFCKSKLGVMEQFLRDVKTKLGSYITLRQEGIENTEKFTSPINNSLSDKTAELISSCGINIVDCCGEEGSQNVIAQLVHEFRNRFGAEVQKGHLQKDMLNLRIIHNADYYAENPDLSDPHEDDLNGYIVQHVTVEDFAKHGVISPDGFEKIMQELLIKADNRQNKMTAFDWQQLNAEQDFSVAVRRRRQQDKTDKAFNYYIMNIHPDGSFSYDCFTDEDYEYSDERDAVKNSYGSFRNEALRYGGEVECLLYHSIDNINAIVKTNEFTCPDTAALYEALKQTQPDTVLIKNEIIQYLDEFAETNVQYRYAALELKEKLKDAPETLTKRELHRMMNMKANAYKELNRWLHREHNVWIYSELKSADSGMELHNLTDIQYYYDEDYDSELNYFVGSKNPPQYRVSRACSIRQLKAEVEPISKDFLFSMLAVDFVRNGQYTVVPFPVKYLKENFFIS